MSDIDGGAAAPAEGTVAPVAEAPVSPPNPISTEREPVAPEVKTEKPADKPKPVESTPREAIERAKAKVESRDRADSQERKEGKFAGKEPAKPVEDASPAAKPVEKAQDAPKAPAAPEPAQKPASQPYEPPARFSSDAKAAWETAPEPVKAEVHRAIRELEEGHKKFRADAEAFHAVREFDDMAKRGGTDLKTALTRYTGLENLLRQNPLEGLKQVVSNLNLKLADGRVLTLDDVAAHISGQSPEDRASSHASEVAILKQEIAALKDQVGGVTKTFEGQREQATIAQIHDFAKDKPRFDELAEDIAFFITSGKAKDLAEAYAFAERLNPASQQAAPNPAPVIPAAAPDPQAHTHKGSKSITGAPASGSDPEPRQASSSVREAIKRAMSAAG